MTRNRELFTSLDSFVQFEVNLGDGNKVIVNGKGVITLHAKNGKKKIVEYFYFVPSLNVIFEHLTTIGKYDIK